MSYSDWKNKVSEFTTMDVRNMQGNFFPAIKKQAEKTQCGEGIKIIQTFEPHPLYPVFEQLGFEHHTEEVDKNEFHAYFYRAEDVVEKDPNPFKPIALLNLAMVDESLGNIAMEFWNLTWNDENRTIPHDMRLLLSLSNAVGAGRFRQATRELIKAYTHGVETAVFDDLFEMFAWNQGIGHFASMIGPSPLFKAYKLIKKQEAQKKSRQDIIAMLMDQFGEGNSEVSVMSK